MLIPLKSGLKQKLIITWVFLTSIIITGAVLFYSFEKETAINQLQNQVKISSGIKINQFDEWHRERLADAKMFSQSPFFANAIHEWILNTSESKLKEDIIERLELININKEYSLIAIADSKANNLLFIGDTISQFDQSTKQHIAKMIAVKKILFTNFYRCNTHKTLHIDYIAPLLDSKDSLFAVIIFRVNPYQNLYPIIEKWPTSIETAKNYIVRNEGDKVIFLNSIWWNGNTDSSESLHTPISDSLFLETISRKNVLIKLKDNWGHDFFAYSIPIPETSWNFIKIVRDNELLKFFKVSKVSLTLLSLFLITFLTLTILSYYYFLRKSEHINILTKEKARSSYYKEFQTILYSIGDGVITTDTLGCITTMNFMAESLTGWREIDAIGCPINKVFKIINHNGRTIADNPVYKVLQYQNIIGMSNHIVLISKDGKEMPISNSAAPIYNDKDELLGVVLVFSDKTVEYESAQKIREGEERYSMLFNNMTQGFALHEIILNDIGNPVDYRFIDVNMAFEQLTGLVAKNIIGKTVKDVFPELEQCWIEIYGKVALTGQPKRFEKFSAGIGRYFDIWTFSPQKGQFATIFSDITEKKKTEETVHKLSKGIEQSPVIVMITDIRGRIEYVNPKFVEVTGYSALEVIGKTPSILSSGNQKKEFYQIMWDTLLAGNDWKGEILNRKKNGEIYWESTLISPIKSDTGEIKYFIAVKEDITVRKQTEIAIQEKDYRLKAQNKELTESNDKIKAINKELMVARKKAEENDRLKSAFLANMSHEFRTPMNGIIGFAELLKRPEMSDEERINYINIIEQSGQRLLDIINNLIDISKIEAGQITTAVSLVNINAELKDLFNFFKRETDQKEIILLMQGGQELQPLSLLTDKPKFISILTNLIKNAIKFTSKGTIDFGYDIGQDQVEFYVSDTGMGIPPKMQSRIFERFVQGDISLSRPYEGAGLGLAITKSYVELLGGKISVDSDEDVGTTFYFTLPISKYTKQGGKVVNEESFDTSIKEKHLTILIAEDDRSSMDYLQSLMEPITEKIFCSSYGENAVQLIKDNPDIDLILMDIRMPDISGVEATRRIRQFNADVIIIAQSAFAFANDKELALAAGCNDYLTKPLKPNYLFQAIIKCINSSVDSNKINN